MAHPSTHNKRPENIGECGNCVFWHDYNKTDAKYAQCRRNPPMHVASFKKGTWPETAKADYCGEFKSR